MDTKKNVTNTWPARTRVDPFPRPMSKEEELAYPWRVARRERLNRLAEAALAGLINAVMSERDVKFCPGHHARLAADAWEYAIAMMRRADAAAEALERVVRGEPETAVPAASAQPRPGRKYGVVQDAILAALADRHGATPAPHRTRVRQTLLVVERSG